MAHNLKSTGRSRSMPVGFAIGVCVSLGTMLILSAFLAKLVSSEKLEWEKIGYGIMIILLITSAMGAKLTCILTKRRKLMSCFFTGLLYWLGLLMITALFFGGQYSGMGVTGCIILCGSMAVSLMELRGERGRKPGMRRNLPVRSINKQ